MEKLLLTPVEVVELTGIGRTRVYALIAGGELPSIKVGRSVRVPAEELRAWISAQRAKATGAE